MATLPLSRSTGVLSRTWQSVKSSLGLAKGSAQEAGRQVGACRVLWEGPCVAALAAWALDRGSAYAQLLLRSASARPLGSAPCTNIGLPWPASRTAALQAGEAVGGVGQYAYDQAVGLKNSAGQTWDEAMGSAYK